MEDTLEYSINDLIISYYGRSLKNNIEFLNIHTETEKNILVSYFYQKIDFQDYDKNVEKVLHASVERMSKQELNEKIELFFSDKIFPSIDKSQFISPYQILSGVSITPNVLRMFFRRILQQTILSFVYTMNKNKKFYNRSLETSIFYDAYLRLLQSLQQYNKAFLNFYIGLVNKYDVTGDYIFPVYNALDENVYFSKVQYNNMNPSEPLKMNKDETSSDQPHQLKELQKNKPYISERRNPNRNMFEFSQVNNKTATAKDSLQVYNVDKKNFAGQLMRGDESVIVKNQLDKMFESNIKHIYDKEEIRQLENILENKKINTLIARKELKLSPGFNNIIQNILSKDISETDRQKFFNDIFDVEDNNDLSKEELYEIYKNEPNKNGFIRYVVDKTMHQSIPSDCNQTNLKVVALVDNIFSKILKEDYDHNTLNLNGPDMKFILMLETLNSIKSSSIGNSSNIVVNLFKDVERTRINKEEIKFN